MGVAIRAITRIQDGDDAPETYAALGLVALPYSIDFDDEPDGDLPNVWTGETWQISSGQAINTPTLGEELLGDPGLEGTYTDGLNSWMINTGGTPTQSADVHGGSKAQQYVAEAVNNNLRTYQTAGTANRWYYATQWLKRASGTSGTAKSFLNQNGGYNDTIGQVPVTSASYAQRKHNLYSSGGTGAIFLYPALEAGSSGFDTIIADDLSLKIATTSTLIASVLTIESDVILRAEIVPYETLFTGLVLRMDNASNPRNYILAHIRRHGTYGWPYAGIWKFVGGVMTEVLAPTYVDADLTTGALFEVRASGATVGIYYNNVQIGTDQTISDARILTNRRHGIFSIAQDCAISRFFCFDQLTAAPLVTAGSSITANLTGYAIQLSNWLNATYTNYDISWSQDSISGTNSWNNLHRRRSSQRIVTIDVANDADNVLCKAALEAFIRKTWTDDPASKMVLVLPPAVTNQNDDATLTTPVNNGALNNTRALAAHYGLPLVDMQDAFQDEIDLGGHLNTYMADTIHWAAPGHTLCLGRLQAIMTASFMATAQMAELPTRLYAESLDFENAPEMKNGTAYDARTGAWTDNGTEVATAEVGATITYSGTFRSIGCSNDDCPAIDYQIDGGEWVQNVVLYQNGLDLGVTSAAHTVTLRCRTTIKITAWWAI